MSIFYCEVKIMDAGSAKSAKPKPRSMGGVNNVTLRVFTVLFT